jgi:2-(acetamidomethylene)succinate hydrolase
MARPRSLPEPGQLSERTVGTGEVTLYCRTAGTGPPVLFCHGITACAAVWDPVLVRISKQFTVVAIDQRGHGRSSKPATGYTAADYARDLLRLVEVIGLGPAVVVGHSLGARNALVAAAQAPGLIAGAVAIDFTPYIEEHVLAELDRRVRAGSRRFASRQEVVAYLRERYPRLPDDAIQRRARHGYTADDGGLRPLAEPHAMAQTLAGLREDLAPALRALRVPALLIRGADSRLVSPAAWLHTRQQHPDVQQLVIDGADHYVPEEAPDQVSDTAMEFVSASVVQGRVPCNRKVVRRVVGFER